MIPGEVLTAAGEIELNAGSPTIVLVVNRSPGGSSSGTFSGTLLSVRTTRPAATA